MVKMHYYALSIPIATNNANIRIDNNNKKNIISCGFYYKPFVSKKDLNVLIVFSGK